MKTFWKNFGKVLGKVALYSAKGAVWASQHPEVVAIVGSVAHVPPGALATAGKVIQVAGAVEAARESASAEKK
jgi:hypothetical protein